MKKEAINIRDPFVLFEDGKYYLYGTRAKDFGCHVGGVDVYVSDDMVDWSEPIECFNSIKYELNRHVNWAPRFISTAENIICLSPSREKTA